MKIPSDSILEIDKNKIEKYLLNPSHPDGKAKADFFITNGIDLSHTEQFENFLKQKVITSEITKELTTLFGKKYIFESLIVFPNKKTHLIRSVWITGQTEKVIKFVFWLALFGTYANFIAVNRSAITGSGKMMPVAGCPTCDPVTEAIILFLLISLSIAMVIMSIIVFFGLYNNLKKSIENV